MRCDYGSKEAVFKVPSGSSVVMLLQEHARRLTEPMQAVR